MNFYLVFHINTSFSSIEEEDIPFVLEKCYWPLINTITQTEVKAGIELSAHSLLKISQIDKGWLQALQDLNAKGQIEIIGSGYTQLIGPLVPAQVNFWNQKIGYDIYSEKNFSPKLALINEMAYSRGIVEHYINVGYEGIVMEWNNPHLYHPEWPANWRYFPQFVTDLQKRKMPVLWADSIAFQKFQRFVHGENDLDEYLSFLKSKDLGDGQFFPLYSNDVEIFDYRPGRFQAETEISSTESEWTRIAELFKTLNEEPTYQFILPSDVLKGLLSSNGGNIVHLESPEQPIPVKKQEKYNINRWALTGRGDLHINTSCFSLHEKSRNSAEKEIWQELCYFWASDFRTHITERRWHNFVSRLTSTLPNQAERRKYSSKIAEGATCIQEKFLTIKNDQFTIILNNVKGCTIHSLATNDLSQPLLGTLEHGFYDDITLGADFYSGHTVIETPAKHKTTDLQPNSFFQDYAFSEGNILTSISSLGDIQQKKIITLQENKFTIEKTLSLPNRTACRIHPFHFTFIPTSWDFSSLYFETHNGGSQLERFLFSNAREIHHGDMLSPLITSRHALGATEGLIVIGDAEKRILFQHNPAKCAMIPNIMMKKANDGQLFLRLQYSIQEIDETFREAQIPSTFHCTLQILTEAAPSTPEINK